MSGGLARWIGRATGAARPGLQPRPKARFEGLRGDPAGGPLAALGEDAFAAAGGPDGPVEEAAQAGGVAARQAATSSQGDAAAALPPRPSTLAAPGSAPPPRPLMETEDIPPEGDTGAFAASRPPPTSGQDAAGRAAGAPREALAPERPQDRVAPDVPMPIAPAETSTAEGTQRPAPAQEMAVAPPAPLLARITPPEPMAARLAAGPAPAIPSVSDRATPGAVSAVPEISIHIGHLSLQPEPPAARKPQRKAAKAQRLPSLADHLKGGAAS